MICLGLPLVSRAEAPVAARARGAEIIVVQATLNTEPKGDLFVGRTADLDFLVKLEDLNAMGFSNPAGATVLLEGEPHMSLRSMSGVSFTFDERRLVLNISAEPRLLPATALSLASRRTRRTPPTVDSGYFNYALNARGGNPTLGTRLGFAGEVGWRSGNFLLQSDGSTVWTTSGERKFVRLMTSLSHDDMDDLRRTVVGDFLVPARDLGTGINLGGISVSKLYSLDPYLVRFPMQTISGNVALPTELEIYLDGHRIRTEQLRPGEFELRDIVSFAGAQSVQLLLRDPFGRVQQLSYSFYFSDQPLQPGLHEYSYNLGAIRRRYGLASDAYGPAAYNLFHRYGINRYLTAGLRAEGTSQLKSIGPLLTLVLGNAGVVNFVAVHSAIGDRSGTAASVAYTYQARRWNFGLSLRHDSRDYAAMGDPPSMTNRRFEGTVGVSRQLGLGGTVSLNHSALTVRREVVDALASQAQPFKVAAYFPRRQTTLSYTAPLMSGRLSFTAMLSHIKESARRSRNEAFVGFTFLLDKRHSVGGSYRRDRESHTETLRLVKSQPIGEGLGYAVGVERFVGAATENSRVDSDIQYNASAAVLRAEYNRSRQREQTVNDYNLSIAGNISHVGGETVMGRPVTGSFGIAKVGELAGVEVLVEGQSMGRTNSKGKIFLPTLNPYFDNEVSLTPSSVPIEYSIARLSRKVSPPLRGGALIDFPVTRIQAFTGRLKSDAGGSIRPVELQEVSLVVDGKSLNVQTGRGGELYLENIKPGTHHGTAEIGGQSCAFELIIPRSEETFVELGDLMCRVAP